MSSGTTNNLIRVAGYSQKIGYAGGIEYRNFTPDLVGVQLASNGGTPLFTMGSFNITTNMEPKTDKTFISNNFSNFISLTDLDLTVEQTQTLLANNADVILNLDKSNLKYYSLFGSLTEFVRVSLEDIITKWPASLFMSPISQTPTGKVANGYTFEDYSYNTLNGIATFKINTTFINNKFGINYLTNGSIIDTFNETNDLRNLMINYLSYSLLYNGVEYPVIGFTGSTFSSNDYIYFKINGNSFSGLSGSSKVLYHIKPNKSFEEQFFNSLPNFEYYLLNRQITPPYTASFKYPIKSDEGVILYITNTLTWPVSDGYNIDFDTTNYISYASSLLDLSNNSDLYSSNLMTRFLVTESISDFDTTPVHLGPLDQDTSGGKMNKTLHIYGREFDDINNFIVGIAFANTVTYDKQDNTPDVYLKNLAKVLGWELISSILEDDLLANYVTTAPSTYSGQTVGLTTIEADTELWRRIILNTPWIWKSKGARKSIEFLLRFIGAPQGLIKFNEYIYKADGPIDVELFTEVLVLNGRDTDLSLYPIDSDGYPTPLPDSPDMYYQNKGLWYRETGGSGSTIDVLTGNNPHLGPYDGGFKYINQFNNLIPNFSPVTISSNTITYGTTNLFTNYSLGTMGGDSIQTHVDVMYIDGSSLSNCVVITAEIQLDPQPKIIYNDCGCNCGPDGDSLLSICINTNDNIALAKGPSCDFATPPIDNQKDGIYTFNKYQYNQNGSVYTTNGNPVYNTTIFVSQDCCRTSGGVPTFYETYRTHIDSNGTSSQVIDNIGYICSNGNGKAGCMVADSWRLKNQSSILLPSLSTSYIGPQVSYLSFTKPDNTRAVVTVDGCNCINTGPSTQGTKAFAIIDSSWFLNTDLSYEVYEPNGKIYGFAKRKVDTITTMKLLVDSINNKTPIGGTPKNFNGNLGYTAIFENNVIKIFAPIGGASNNNNIVFMIARLPNTTSVSSYKFIFGGGIDGNKTTLTNTVPNITDPYSGVVGFGCQLTQDGLNDLALGVNGYLYKKYNKLI